MDDLVDFGCDFDSSFELLSPGGHFKLVAGIENAKQVIENGLTTIPKDLDLFNYDHPHNNAYLYLGATNVNFAKALIKLATEEVLIRKSVVKEIIDIEVDYKLKQCIVDICVRLVDDTILELSTELNNYEEDL